MKNKKRAVAAALVTLFLILAVPLVITIFGFCLPHQFGATYYAKLPKMTARLNKSRGKRIIVVGGSSVAFGLRNDLMQDELSDYTVCPFGLYAAIGTKAMIDLSRADIREGDIVVLAPEQSPQSLSTYFGSKYLWRAVEEDTGLLTRLKYENLGAMVGAFPEYAGEKFGYWKNGDAPSPDGIYSVNSFDENCTLVYDRPHNIMDGGFDPTTLISYDSGIMSAEFADYVNDYCGYIRSKGAELYFGFSPTNASAISPGTDEDDIAAYYDALDKRLDCRILGNPVNYVYDCEWFYDNNVHCNSAGAVLYTRTLVKDLKAELGITSPTEIDVPEKPALPDDSQTGEGDNGFADCFTYDEKDGRVVITGLTEKGASQRSIIVPYSYGGQKISSFSAQTFAGNKNITEIKLQTNIRSIADGSFRGCDNLSRLYVADNENPSACIVKGGLLEGAPSCRIYVKSAMLTKYATDYFWSRFASYMTAY